MPSCVLDGARAEIFQRAARLAVDAARALMKEIDGRDFLAEEDFEADVG